MVDCEKGGWVGPGIYWQECMGPFIISEGKEYSFDTSRNRAGAPRS